MTEQELRTKLLELIKSVGTETLSNLAIYSVLVGITHMVEVMVDLELTSSLMKQEVKK
jgi:hypothetical protein